MANNKNQHFVPQVYLRGFGCDPPGSEQKRTNAFIIKRRQTCPGVSIKKQCSKDFFYGKEEVFDEYAKFFEGRHGLTMKALREGGEVYLNRITSFFLLQYLRTPHMLAQRRVTSDHMNNLARGMGARADPVTFVNSREMQHQLYIAAKESKILDDLEPVLLRNRTKVPFITSDNPAICMNRFQSQRLGDPTSGLVTSGLIALMPLDSEWAFFAYDRDVYSVQAVDSKLEIKNENDVHRMNELQALMATDCLYFSDMAASAHVEKAFRTAEPRRRASWTEIWVGILDGEENGLERYRREKPEDSESKQPRISSNSPIMPSPHSWPTFFKFKARPKGCETGTMVGYIRPGASRYGKYGAPPLVTLPRSSNPNLSPLTREFGYVGKGA